MMSAQGMELILPGHLQVGVVWSVCLWLPGIRKAPKISGADWMSLAPIGTSHTFHPFF